jgi:hypothetical protein
MQDHDNTESRAGQGMTWAPDNGGPAFPQPDLSGYGMGPVEGPDGQYQMQGMTLRDWFAGQALAGIAASGSTLPYKDDADMAYKYADAMLAARKGTAQ